MEDEKRLSERFSSLQADHAREVLRFEKSRKWIFKKISAQRRLIERLKNALRLANKHSDELRKKAMKAETKLAEFKEKARKLEVLQDALGDMLPKT
jgi:chromosome segregation ATPase